jgi:uncharacterized membrane protein YeiH
VFNASLPFLVLDLAGVFAFALDGALTAIQVARLDLVGVVTLGTVTALGGGILRDVVLDALPPATFSDGRYLAVAAVGSLVAFTSSRRLERWRDAILVLDAAGLSLFAVSGALKTLDLGGGPAQAVVLGAVTAVGGGTLRDVLIGRVPVVLRSELYAIPALLGALVLVTAAALGASEAAAAVVGAALCFAVRVLGVRFGLAAPTPPGRDPGA